jgi:hypothetical protein
MMNNYSMDRISAYEDSVEEESTTRLQPLNFPALSRFQVKKPYAPRNKIEALKHEIYEFFKPYPQPKISYGFLCGTIKAKNYDRAEQIFRKLQSDMKDQRSSITNPPALWLWQMFPPKESK